MARAPEQELLCPHHASADGVAEGFRSAANKIWCDCLHRGVPIPRLFDRPMTDSVWD